MLNEKGERELAYVVKVDDIKPIPGRDRVECAMVGGWTVMVRKGQFKPGDTGIYFEIDSKVPEREPFEFLALKHYRIKTQKYKTPDGQFWSQGLLMSAEDFGWVKFNDARRLEQGEWVSYTWSGIFNEKDNEIYFLDNDSRFLTKKLGVTYAEAEDNKRKAASVDKYKRMALRNGKLFAKQPFRWLMRREWGKKLLFIFFGKKKDEKYGWPEWVRKTDEERIQNCSYILDADTRWISTEKLDGSSTTFTIRRGKHKWSDPEFYVCSRNVCFKAGKEPLYYDANVYTEMAEKYNVREVLERMLGAMPNEEWITIQGETFGPGVQKRDYGLEERQFAAFNLIYSSRGRVNSVEMANTLSAYDIPTVPILAVNIELPKNVDEVLKLSDGKSYYDGGMREGIVYRSADGKQSFKAVSNEYLLKYH